MSSEKKSAFHQRGRQRKGIEMKKEKTNASLPKPRIAIHCFFIAPPLLHLAPGPMTLFLFSSSGGLSESIWRYDPRTAFWPDCLYFCFVVMDQLKLKRGFKSDTLKDIIKVPFVIVTKYCRLATFAHINCIIIRTVSSIDLGKVTAQQSKQATQ